MPTRYSNFTVALIQAPPANKLYSPPATNWYGQLHDLNATIEFGDKFIERAALEGANFVAFPELWFPGLVQSILSRPNVIILTNPICGSANGL